MLINDWVATCKFCKTKITETFIQKICNKFSRYPKTLEHRIALHIVNLSHWKNIGDFA